MSSADLASRYAPSEIIDRRDRDGHPIALVYLDQPNSQSRIPSAYRCQICGEALGKTAGASRLDHHFRASPECREAICEWLEERRTARVARGEIDD